MEIFNVKHYIIFYCYFYFFFKLEKLKYEFFKDFTKYVHMGELH